MEKKNLLYFYVFFKPTHCYYDVLFYWSLNPYVYRKWLLVFICTIALMIVFNLITWLEKIQIHPSNGYFLSYCDVFNGGRWNVNICKVTGIYFFVIVCVLSFWWVFLFTICLVYMSILLQNRLSLSLYLFFLT